VRRDLALGDALELEVLAAGEDGHGNLAVLGGREDEDHLGRRLLEGLQQRVEGRVREHVDFVDDEDAVAVAAGGVADRLTQLAHVVDAVVGGAVDLEDVER
jgi:hypothetical protein